MPDPMPSDRGSIIGRVHWVGDVTTVVGALGGAAVGVRGGLAISRSERREATRGRIAEAFSAFLAAVGLSVAELRQWPSPREPNALQHFATRAQDRLHGEGTSGLAARRSARATFGDRPWHLGDAGVQAWAFLRVLPLAPEARSACDAAVSYVQRLG